MLRNLLLLACLTPLIDASGAQPRPMLGLVATMAATPVALDPSDPARVQVGALTYLGGVHLTSPDTAFGSFSSMLVDGDRFTLLGDGGTLVRFRMGADWRPREVSFGDLPDGPGRGSYKYQRDSESMTRDPATGSVWVGFERANAIWRYGPDLARAQQHATPAAMRRWPENGGAESLLRLRNGQFIVLSEALPKDGKGSVGLWFAGDPTQAGRRPTRFRYLPPKGYQASDLTQLPDGRLLVLNRRFSLSQLFTAKLTIVDPAHIRSDAAVKGVEIATLAAPLLHDNFEGIAAVREGADTILWIVSDDNSQFWERSLLLKFRLNPAPVAHPPKPR